MAAIQRSFFVNGERYDRLSIRFACGWRTEQVRAVVQDAIIRAHGFRAIRDLTDGRARSGQRFQVAIARRKISLIVKRLRELVLKRRILVWIAGSRLRLGKGASR